MFFRGNGCARTRYAKPILLVVAIVCLPALLMAQSPVDNKVHIEPLAKSPTPPPAVTDPAMRLREKPIKVDVDLVLVSVTVTDPMNRLVTGLERENFQVFDSNALQDIRHFSSEDAPISLGVIFDVSGSMSNKIQKSRDAIVEFFKTANPQDEFFLITFSDKPELLQDFTNSIEDIQGRLVYAIPKGRTSLFDAVYLGINKMREAKHPKKALLIISDGGDNRSRYTDNEVKALVKEADVQIYAIGLFDDVRGTPEEVRGPYMLQELTDPTGGRMFPVNDVSEMADTAVKIGVELRNQYVLGFRPSNKQRDGRWRKLKVKLNAPKGLPLLKVNSKSGYYAPQP